MDISNVDVNSRDKLGNTPLHKAIMDGDEQLVQLLIEFGADVNAKDKYGDTPLVMAIESENERVVKMLLDAGVNINVVNKYRVPPIQFAATNENEKIVQLLIEAGADINSREESSNAPLLLKAIRYSNEKVAKLLIKLGADVNGVDKHKSTPLHSAVNKDYPALVELLITSGADVNAKDKDGKTPLFYAATQRIVKMLMDKGADVNAKDKYGSTPLYLAILNGTPKVAELFIKSGARVRDTYIKLAKRKKGMNDVIPMLTRNLKEQMRKEADYRYWILKNQESLAAMPRDFRRRLSYDAHYREFCKNSTVDLPISEVIALAELLDIKIDPTWNWKQLCKVIYQKLWPQ